MGDVLGPPQPPRALSSPKRLSDALSPQRAPPKEPVRINASVSRGSLSAPVCFFLKERASRCRIAAKNTCRTSLFFVLLGSLCMLGTLVSSASRRPLLQRFVLFCLPP